MSKTLKSRPSNGPIVSTFKVDNSFSPVKFFNMLCAENRTPYVAKLQRKMDPGNPALCAGDYVDAYSFKHDYMCYNVIRKLNDGSAGSAKKRADAAIKKYVAVDNHLGELRNSLSMTSEAALGRPVTRAILHSATRKIERLLGPVPDLVNIAQLCSFSGGATALLKRKHGHPAFKYSCEYPEVTPDCVRLVDLFRVLCPGWSTLRGYTLVGGNRVTTVPKDSEIDRPIACEPTLNMWVQKGIGAFIRDSLRAVGIDLKIQQERNRKAAMLGSITGTLATIDLASASDSISIELCRLLLPHNWFMLIMMARSDSGTLPNGDEIVYNKVSSMGNGFTFELETLLFWAISQAVEDECSRARARKPYPVHVYGDDIILSTYSVPFLIDTLSFCGFSTNKEKSFYSGPFRESCGGHYWNGINVTPFFLKAKPTVLTDLFLLVNSLKRWASVRGSFDPTYDRSLAYVTSFVPDKWKKPRIPDGYGDGAIIGTFDEVTPSYCLRSGVFRTKIVAKVAIRSKQPTFHIGIGGLISSLADNNIRYKVNGDDLTENDVDMSKQHEWNLDQQTSLSFTDSVVPGEFRLRVQTLELSLTSFS